MNALVYKLKDGWAETLKRYIVQSSNWYMSTYEISHPRDKNIYDTMTKYRSC
jgi:DNA-directed RNA polymerase subunit L